MLTQMFIPIILLLWAGMILGISCLEAWVKFKAPTLTKQVGLDVGRTVFQAFQYTQWGLAILLFLAILFFQLPLTYFVIPISLGVLLGLQTFWFFPMLCINVELILAEKSSRKNAYHAWYALLEIGKLCLLIGSSLCWFYSMISTKWVP